MKNIKRLVRILNVKEEEEEATSASSVVVNNSSSSSTNFDYSRVEVKLEDPIRSRNASTNEMDVCCLEDLYCYTSGDDQPNDDSAVASPDINEANLISIVANNGPVDENHGGE